MVVGFRLVGEVEGVETIAEGNGIREFPRLVRMHGLGRWRKRKGIARVEIEGGSVRLAELHWYEAHGMGRVEMKIKRFLD